MTEQPKFDEAPDQDFINQLHESFVGSDVSKLVSMDHWAKDKTSDFYMGMMAAVDISIRAAQGMITTGAPPEAIINELQIFNGQISTIIKEKESKIILL